MSKHVIEYDCQCESCSGSGLYIGFAEQDGFAIICHDCKGTGKRHMRHTYNDFNGRKDKKGIKRVLQFNPGIGMGLGKEGGELFTEKSFGGLSYKDWKNGENFVLGTEMRAFVCPTWWYQSVDLKKKPNWKQCIVSGAFPSCKNFKNKEKCWDQFDKRYEITFPDKFVKKIKQDVKEYQKKIFNAK